MPWKKSLRILKEPGIIHFGLHKITSFKLSKDSKELKRCTTKAGLRNFKVTTCHSTSVYQSINSSLCHWFHLGRKTERKAADMDTEGQNETVGCYTWKASIYFTTPSLKDQQWGKQHFLKKKQILSVYRPPTILFNEHYTLLSTLASFHNSFPRILPKKPMQCVIFAIPAHSYKVSSIRCALSAV